MAYCQDKDLATAFGTLARPKHVSGVHVLHGLY